MTNTTIKRLLYKKTKNGKHYEICMFKFENSKTKTRYVAYNLTDKPLVVQIDYETYAVIATMKYKHPIALSPNGGGLAIVPYGHSNIEIFCFLQNDHKDCRHVTHMTSFQPFATRDFNNDRFDEDMKAFLGTLNKTHMQMGLVGQQQAAAQQQAPPPYVFIGESGSPGSAGQPVSPVAGQPASPVVGTQPPQYAQALDTVSQGQGMVYAQPASPVMQGQPPQYVAQPGYQPVQFVTQPGGQPVAYVMQPGGQSVQYVMQPGGQPVQYVAQPGGQPVQYVAQPGGQPLQYVVQGVAPPQNIVQAKR
ncbi:hypothetical protein HK097_005107 [Rhizophlyctis rosea]|uniref:Uncharacterized protein n=1 Tax=Rhizophlyctis rosea TaxID=64517 RepID=A0AAD5SGZ1_9FUNG|nr:hypothetical protein HK097_005107 [Rhizophlyctis rosea]